MATILQFGAGNFLRAFVDLFVQEINEAGAAPPAPNNGGARGGTALCVSGSPIIGGGGGSPLRVVIVQSTEGERARLLNKRGGRYQVLVRGMQGGAPIERVQQVASIERAYVAATEWPAVVEAVRAPELVAVTSNTTEAGYVLDDADTGWSDGKNPPSSFPARLLALLRERHADGGAPVAVLPCELFDENATRLRELVLEQARRWDRTDAAFLAWLRDGCTWADTLVDRIVSGKPAEHPLLAEDPLLTVTEPYAFWAVENKPGLEWLRHPAIHLVDDVAPYALRKVRILNGAHSALVAHVRQTGREDIRFVREAVADPQIGDWLRGLLFEEIVPTIADRAPQAEEFARQTLERFANPFLDHKLSDIALHHDKKVPVRLVPTLEEFRAKFDREPVRLAEVIAGA